MLRNLEEYVSQLREISKTERDAFLADSIKIGAARYYLQIAIETCLNIGNHVIATEGFRAPEDYRDIVTVLKENGILPEPFAETMSQMVGLRNRLVHLYWVIDDDRIYDNLREQLTDFEVFTRHILEFVETQLPPDGSST
jgi:uncharacterized protein YutE (UPF0331/DUF86 family)